MTEEQQITFVRSLRSILQFYQYGMRCAPIPPVAGKFVEMFKTQAPDFYEGNEEFIREIGDLTVKAFNVGVRHRQQIRSIRISHRPSRS